MLEQYRVSLENVESQAEIATIMAEFGYDSEKVAQGKTLLTETRQAFDSNKTEDDETSASYSDFIVKKNKLVDTYSLHRKKVKVIFRKDSLTADKLGVTGSLPQTYIKWFEVVKKLYAVACNDRTY